MSALSTALTEIGIPAEDLPGGLVLVRRYAVHIGRHKGEKVDVALVGVDYPVTPPAGVHVNAQWGADRPNVGASQLGSNWRYFSRRHSSWVGRDLIHVVVGYLNRVLGDA